MANIHVLADYERPSQITDVALLARTTALEAMHPGGVLGFAEAFDACLIPDLEACGITGKDNIRAALRALEDHGFEYGREMIAVEAEINHYGPRRIHLLMSQEENRRGIEKGGTHDNS